MLYSCSYVCGEGAATSLWTLSKRERARDRLSLTADAAHNAQKTSGGQVIFPLCIRSSSAGGPDSLTHKPTQTAEVSARASHRARGSKPTPALWKANHLFPVHWMSYGAAWVICGVIVALGITWDYSRWWPTAWKYTWLYKQPSSQETVREWGRERKTSPQLSPTQQ